jgi:Ca2+-binding EF-hand superfamily protein
MLDTENIRSQIIKVFDHFDDDSSGFLDFKKIKTMVGECFFNIDNDAIKNMIESADTDGDMKISRYEFMRIMKKVRLL